MRKLIAALVGATFLTGTAWGADLGGASRNLSASEAAALPGNPSWSTCHAGIEGGLQSAVTDPALFGMDGFLYGLRAGCDYQIGRIVVGGFAGYDWGKLTSKSGGLPDLTADTWYFGGELGFLLTPHTMVYGLVDRPEMKIEVSGFSKSFDGIGVGAGVRHMFAQNISGGLEYQFQKYDSVLPGIDADVHQVRASVDFHFPIK